MSNWVPAREFEAVRRERDEARKDLELLRSQLTGDNMRKKHVPVVQYILTAEEAQAVRDLVDLMGRLMGRDLTAGPIFDAWSTVEKFVRPKVAMNTSPDFEAVFEEAYQLGKQRREMLRQAQDHLAEIRATFTKREGE